jgi:hypothetical protein
MLQFDPSWQGQVLRLLHGPRILWQARLVVKSGAKVPYLEDGQRSKGRWGIDSRCASPLYSPL